MSRIPSILEDEQLEALLANAPMPFDLMLLLAARAGLRHQEILHLQVRDIDLRGPPRTSLGKARVDTQVARGARRPDRGAARPPRRKP